MIDECPGWGTLEHDEVLGDPGDHEAQIVTFTNGHTDLVSMPGEGIEVLVALAGHQGPLRIPR